jgi:hypothetical protein
MDEDVARDELIGQWLMTTKYLFMDPRYCMHAEEPRFKYKRHGKDANGNWSYPSIEGWFPLIDGNFKTNEHSSCGEIMLKIHWYHLPGFEDDYQVCAYCNKVVQCGSACCNVVVHAAVW